MPNESRQVLGDLKSCGMRGDLQWGRRIHATSVKRWNDSDIYILTALVKMYANCGTMVDARGTFDSIQRPNVVSWNVLLLGYVDNGDGLVALELFSMMKVHKCVPSSITYVAALKACGSLVADSGKKDCLKRGKEIHSEIGCHLDHFVLNMLIDMYSKCGSMVDARGVFESIQNPDVVSWTALLLGYAENGEALEALNLFARMKTSGCAPNSVTYIVTLKACTYLASNGYAGCLERGREIQSEIGVHLNHYLRNTLIGMYSKCGSMLDASLVFESTEKPDVVSWNALILGYAENGEGIVALELFSRMKTRGCAPTSITYVAALKACTSLAVNADLRLKQHCLKWGKQIHLTVGYHMDHYVQNALIEMYAKLGSMVEARFVFDSIHKPDVVSWTSLIMGYAENDEEIVALELFSRMKAGGCSPDSLTYVASVMACTYLAKNADCTERADCLERGRAIHMEIGDHLNQYVQNALICMYAKCGSMVDARCVFGSIQEPNVLTWNALLLGHVDNGEGLFALDLFSKMKTGKCAPDSVTYAAVIRACCLTGALAPGRKFHSEITEFTGPLVTCLVDFYAKCGSMIEARKVFYIHSRLRDVSTWTALLGGYSTFGDTISVFKLFDAMQDEGFQPDAVTFVCVLLSCSHAGLVDKAREYFVAMPVKYHVTHTIMHYNCMLDVLGRANRLDEAIAMLRNMPCNPDSFTWTGLLDACRKWKNVELARLTFLSSVSIKKDASSYVLMALIYGSRSMWKEQELVLRLQTGI